jgi:membrane protease subunit (stomatin/prohibitin family)
MSDLSIIRFDGSNNALVVKSIEKDFFSKTDIIVNESQEALLYKDGKAMDLFTAGRHKLNEDSLRAFKRFFGNLFGKSGASCNIYFINKATVMDVSWGTNSPITMMDPVYDIMIVVTAYGQLGVRVTDSYKFVTKLVGQLPEFSIDNLKKSIKGVLVACIKRTIAGAIMEEKVSILEVNAHILDISQRIQSLVNKYIADEYGIEVVNLYVESISTADEYLDKLRRVKEKRMEALNDIDIDAIRTTRMGEAKAKSRAMQGFTYQDERRFDVLETAAKNAAVAAAAFDANKDALSATGAPAAGASVCPSCASPVAAGAKFCANCGAKMPENRFCSQCGAKVAAGAKFCPACGSKII